MNQSANNKLERLRADFKAVNGCPFSHFYCPILYRDEETELIRGHVVNQAFRSASRSWTIQRKDVDAFYGTMFEADFVDVQEMADISPAAVITNTGLTKRFNLKFLLENEPVEHLSSKKGIPEPFTPLVFEGRVLPAPFGLKMSVREMAAAQDKQWAMEISRDLRLPVLVSAIKAAHLTLFKLLGYEYINSAASHFVGRTVLGEFFLQNQGKSKLDVLKAATDFFQPYVHMVRPLLPGSTMDGTATDKQMLMCSGSSGTLWAAIVFVKTSDVVHSVMLPAFPEGAATYQEFLKNTNASVHTTQCCLADSRFEIDVKRTLTKWPKVANGDPDLLNLQASLMPD